MSRSYAPSTSPRFHVWKRTASLAVAIALLALPVSVLADHVADHVEGGDEVTAIITAPVITTVTDPDYVWDGRLAGSYTAPFDAPLSTPAFVWDPAEQASMVRDHVLLEHASEEQD